MAEHGQSDQWLGQPPSAGCAQLELDEVNEENKLNERPDVPGRIRLFITIRDSQGNVLQEFRRD